MADQHAAAEQAAETESSAQAEIGTQEETAAAQENWEQRFKDTQAWATQLAQQKVELEARAQVVADLESDDPEKYNAALRKLGFNVPEEEDLEDIPTQVGVDPQTRAELDELKQWRQAQEADREAQENEREYRSLVDPQLQAMNVPKGLWDLVAEAAWQLDGIPTPQGLQPDLEGAMRQVEAMAEHFAELPSVQQRAMKKWRETKPKAALTGVNGAEGTRTPQLETAEDKTDFILEQLSDH